MVPPPRSTGRTSGLVSTPSWTAGWSSARRSRSRSKANSSSSHKRPRRPRADIADPSHARALGLPDHAEADDGRNPERLALMRPDGPQDQVHQVRYAEGQEGPGGTLTIK